MIPLGQRALCDLVFVSLVGLNTIDHLGIAIKMVSEMRLNNLRGRVQKEDEGVRLLSLEQWSRTHGSKEAE